VSSIRVLLATPLCNVGGTELSTLSIAKWLKKAGHQVTVIGNEHLLGEEFAKEGIDLVLGGMDRRGAIGLVQGIRALRDCTLDRHVDLIDAQMAYTAVQAAVAAHTIHGPRVPVVWHCRGVKAGSYRVMARLCGRLIDFAVANCEAERSRLLEEGLRPDRVRTIYNCANIDFPEDPGCRDVTLRDEWAIGPETVVVGSVSRLAAHRGNRHFLEAISILASQGSLRPVRFLIVGDGPDRAMLSNLASDLGIADLVTFTGARRDMDCVYSTLDIVVNPTLWGMGTGNVNAEAMAWGRPVVASDVGGISELVEHSRTGLLVPPGDSSELAGAILHLLEHPSIASQMGLAGRRKVEGLLSPVSLLGQIEEVYSFVLRRNGQKPFAA
jgi:glycosyltransferase involved in cell wall biosynthesis